MRVEASCKLRWHEHDLNVRVAADVTAGFDCLDFGPTEVLQHDGPSALDGEELMESHVNLMNAMDALGLAYEKAVKT